MTGRSILEEAADEALHTAAAQYASRLEQQHVDPGRALLRALGWVQAHCRSHHSPDACGCLPLGGDR